MKITLIKKPFEIEMKRCYLPFIVETKCPKCGYGIEVDLSNCNYLSYPRWNSDEECINFICDECYHEWSKNIRLEVKMIPV